MPLIDLIISNGVISILLAIGLILYLSHISELIGISSILTAVVFGTVYAFLGFFGF